RPRLAQPGARGAWSRYRQAAFGHSALSRNPSPRGRFLGGGGSGGGRRRDGGSHPDLTSVAGGFRVHHSFHEEIHQQADLLEIESLAIVSHPNQLVADPSRVHRDLL